MGSLRFNRSALLIFAVSILIELLISGSLASYTNGKSRYQEFRGCNGTASGSGVPEAISQEDESLPSSPSPPTSATITSTSPPKDEALTTKTTNFPQNNYFQPVILGPTNLGLGTRFGGISFGSNRLQIRPQNSFGFGSNGNNEINNENRAPLLGPIGSRIAQVHQSVLAYRNQITGNRFFDMDEGAVKFKLYTRNNPSIGQKIQRYTADPIEVNDFNASKPTKLIIHGFSEIGNMGEWVTNLRDAYLSSSEANVIVADFSSYETFLLFWTNLPVFASKRIADLVTFLELTAGASRENFHIIARSYGTHVAGVTGRLLQGRIGRITGLEPEPRVYGAVFPDYRLISSDAQFVDIVRVNGRRYFFHGARFGLAPPTGHVDIYPNFSERNSACPGNPNSYGRANFGYCQQGRGVSYFTESIKYPQTHRMCQCRSYTDYKSGNCFCTKDNSDFYLGEYMSNQTRGVFQLISAAVRPTLLRSVRLFG